MDSYKQHFYNRNPAARKVADSSAAAGMSPRTHNIYNSATATSCVMKRRRSVCLTGPAARLRGRARLSRSLKIQASAFHLTGKGALFMEGIFDQTINYHVEHRTPTVSNVGGVCCDMVNLLPAITLDRHS